MAMIFMNKSNIIKAIIISPIFMSLKYFHAPIFKKEELLIKCHKEGLFHITKEEHLIKILESGYLKASSKEISYGNEKYFYLLAFLVLKIFVLI